MFVVKVNGVPKSVLNTYDAAVGFAEMIRRRGKRITVVALPIDELRVTLHYIEKYPRYQEVEVAGEPIARVSSSKNFSV